MNKHFLIFGISILCFLSFLIYYFDTNSEITTNVNQNTNINNNINHYTNNKNQNSDDKCLDIIINENNNKNNNNDNNCMNDKIKLQNNIYSLEQDNTLLQKQIDNLLEQLENNNNNNNNNECIIDDYNSNSYLTNNWPKRKGQSKVLLVGFPSSGLDTLRKLLSKITKNPTFSVYTENLDFIEDTKIDTSDIGLWSNCFDVNDCNLNNEFPIIIKTFFPAVIMQSNIPEYDKMIHIIRNPIDTIESFYRMCKVIPWLASRQRAWEYHLKREIDEYKKLYDYWRRMQLGNNKSTLFIRYEDLCENMEYVLNQVFLFLDINYLIDKNILSSVLQEEQCIKSEHIGSGLHEYSSEQLSNIQSSLASILRDNDYGELMDEFNA